MSFTEKKSNQMKDLIAKESTLDEKLNAREASFDKQNH